MLVLKIKIKSFDALNYLHFSVNILAESICC